MGDKHVTAFRSSKIPALIGLLASRPGPWIREQVASLLWPDRLATEGRHNLRQIALHIRQLMGDGVIDGSYQTISLNSAVETDLHVLLGLEQNEGPIDSNLTISERALSLCRGEFLEGFTDEWIMAVRSRCDRALVTALLHLADRDMKASPESSLKYVNRAIDIEPFMDRARARKIRILKLLGEDTAAHLEFASYRDLLLEQFGIVPSGFVSDSLKWKPESSDRSTDTPRLSIPVRTNEQDVDFLISEDSPSEALALATAFVPVWIGRGKLKVGLGVLDSILQSGHQFSTKAVEQRGRVAYARLLVEDGQYGIARTMVESLLPTLDDPPARARALICLAHACNAAHQGETAARYAAMALGTAELSPELLAEERVEALRRGAEAAIVMDRTKVAEDLSRRAVILAKELGLWRSYINASVVAASVRLRGGHKQEAAIAIREALDFVRDKSGIEVSRARVRMARFLEEAGDVGIAEDGYRRGIEEARAFDDDYGLCMHLTYLGDYLTSVGKAEESLIYHEEARKIRSEFDQKLGLATSLRGIGKARVQLGQFEEAQASLSEGVRLFRECDAPLGEASVYYELARLAQIRHDPERARRLAKRVKQLLTGCSPLVLGTIGPYADTLLMDADRIIAKPDQVLAGC